MTEKLIEVENGSIWTKKVGQGIPVLLISGGPGMYNYLEPVATLIDEYCEVILFDPKGCGRSSYIGDGYDLYSSIQDMEEIRRAYGYEKWIVLGHSWGADLGLAYSLAHPNSITRFVSISGTGIQNDRDWKDIYTRNKLAAMELIPDFQFGINKTVHRALIDSWRSYIKNAYLLKQISESQVPTLFIFAENDIRPSWPIQQLAALMKYSEYIKMQDAGHYIWLEKAAQKNLANILRNYLVPNREERN